MSIGLFENYSKQNNFYCKNICHVLLFLRKGRYFMAEYNTTCNFSNLGTPNEVRMRVVEKFSQEAKGRGKQNLASRYTYYVETLSDGNRIYLRRPAFLHNGFDFLVCVENVNFSTSRRKRNAPTHEDILTDLKIKSTNEPELYKEIYSFIQKTYNCQEVTDAQLLSLNFTSGKFSAEMIIKVLKWLFIEQDIRYWNYSGRDMLFSNIPATVIK